MVAVATQTETRAVSPGGEPSMSRDVPKAPRRTFILAPSNFLSRLMFAWVAHMLILCNRFGPKAIDFKIGNELQAAIAAEAVRTAWPARPGEASVHKALYDAFGRRFVLAGVWKIVWAVCTWTMAFYLLRQMMRGPSWTLAFSLLVAAVISAMSIQLLYLSTFETGLKVRASLVDAIFRKSLVLSPANVNIGRIVTLVSTDVEAIVDAASNFHFLWSGALEVLAILVISFSLAGWRSALAPIVLIIVILGIQLYLGFVVSEASRKWISTSGERLHLMTEILTAIKLIKFYAWEVNFHRRISEVRRREAFAAQRQIMARAINFAFVFAAPVLATLSCLGVLQLTNSKLDAILAFTLVSLFNTLRYPLLLMPLAVKSFSSAQNSLGSIDQFLSLPELITQVDESSSGESDDTGVSFDNATLRWDGASSDTLFNVSLSVRPGEIVAIVGDVGSGKSSIIAAMLGQMQVSSGRIRRRGSVSYCPQEAWLINETLQENILFGTPMDRERYNHVIQICGLVRDLSLFAGGDQLSISERGANLSGGQRQRVSMARAVYNHSSIVLLDDPLSALDQAVGRQIFSDCIKGYLRDRAVVLVTHQLQYLEHCTRIAVVSGGHVLEYGTFTQLMNNSTGALREMLTDIHNTIQEPEEPDRDLISLIRVPSVLDVSLVDSRRGSLTGRDETAEDSLRRGKDSIELSEIRVDDENPANSSTQIVAAGHPGSTSPNESKINRIAEYNQNLIRSSRTVDESMLSRKAEHDMSSLFGPKHLPLDANGHDNRDFARTVAHNMIAHLTMTATQKPRLPMPMDVPLSHYVPIHSAWRRYLRESGGMATSVSIFCLFWFVHMLRISADLWVKVWQGAPGSSFKAASLGLNLDLAVFAIIVVSFSLGVLFRGVLTARLTARKADQLHADMVGSLLVAPMAFYDKTSLGRILQSSSKHQADADDRLPDSLLQWMQYFPLAVGSTGVMIWQSPHPFYLLIVIVLLCVLAAILISLPRRSGVSEVINQGDSEAKSVMFSHIAASLEGLFSIRAFTAQTRFIQMLVDRLDTVSIFQLAGQSHRFFDAMYIDVLCSLAIFSCATIFVVTPTDSSTIGLGLSNALQLLVFVQWTMRMWEESNASMKSIGQLQYFGRRLPREAASVIAATEPDPSWPNEGTVVFKDVVLRYSTFGVAVLKRINFVIKPKEKIGIVGRTGSGKSTLLIALLRIVEISRGKITIDGVDISKIGLTTLRRHIAVIPQESVLFSGTIRGNLDPFNKYSDAQLWHSLQAVNLDATVQKFSDKLDTSVAEQGPRFSLGQRQLFCIARAILSKSKLIILDEATAAIDTKTDTLVQKAITENFADCTVLTIAHRLNTIIDSDRIMVMSAGKIVEFDQPITLLNDPKSHFSSLVDQTGAESAKALRQMATEQAVRLRRKSAGLRDSQEFTDLFLHYRNE